jgi:hypothetical protein
MKTRHGTATRKVVNKLPSIEGSCAERTEAAVTRRPQVHGDLSYTETLGKHRHELHGDLSYKETSGTRRPELHGDLRYTETSVHRI